MADFYTDRLARIARRQAYKELIEIWRSEHGDDRPPKSVIKEWKKVADKRAAQEKKRIREAQEVKARTYYSKILDRRVTIPED